MVNTNWQKRLVSLVVAISFFCLIHVSAFPSPGTAEKSNDAAGVSSKEDAIEKVGETAVEKPAAKKKSRKIVKIIKFLLIAGLVVAGTIVLLKILKKSQRFSLAVTITDGVDGTLDAKEKKLSTSDQSLKTETNYFKRGEKIGYDFKPITGYRNVVVKIDGKEVETTSGEIIMDQGHTLSVTTEKNILLSVVLKEGIDGNPMAGDYPYSEGEKVFYRYSLKTGYKDLTVSLDGIVQNYSPGTEGEIIMDKSHKLIVSTNQIKQNLEVKLGNGIDGEPSQSDLYIFGANVNYSYKTKLGYYQLRVLLDELNVSSSGNFFMKADHCLDVNAVNGWELEWLFSGDPYKVLDTSQGNKYRNGSVFNNATLIADAKGNPNSAFSFDGFDDYINGPRFIAHSNNCFTVSFKVKLSDQETYPRQFISGTDFSFSQTKEQEIEFKITSGSNPSLNCGVSKENWVHIVGTFDGSALRIFVNGAEMTSASNISTLPNQPSFFVVGGLEPLYWKGCVDDIRVFSYALNQEEVYKVMNQ